MCIRLAGQVPLPAAPSHFHKGFGYLIVLGYLMVEDSHFKARVSEAAQCVRVLAPSLPT